MRLSSRLINNALFNLFGRVWPILLGLLTTPYIVHRLGVEANGILVLVSVILGYMILLDLGLNASLVKYISQYYAIEDFETIKSYTGTSLVIYAIVGIVGSLTIFGLTDPLVNLLPRLPPDLRAAAQFAFHMGAVSFSIGLIGSVFSAIVIGLQRYDLSNLLSISLSTMRSVGTVLILWQGLWLREVVLFHVLVNFISFGLYLFLSKRLVPGLSFRLAFVPDIARSLVSFGFMTLISRVSGILLFQFDRTYIGFALGAASVTYYAIADNLGRKMHSFPQAMTMTVFPLASELTSTNRIQTLRHLYLRGLKWSVVLAVSMTVVIAPLSFKVLYYWMGPEFAEVSTNPLRLLLVAYCITAFTAVPYYIIDGSGLPHYNALFALASTIINIIGCIVLIPQWGLVGAAAANVLVIFIVPIYINFVERRVLNIKGAGHLFDIYIRPFAAAIPTFLFVCLIQYYWVNNLIELLLTAGGGMVIFGLFALIFRVLRKEDIEILLQYLNTLWSQGKFIVQYFT